MKQSKFTILKTVKSGITYYSISIPAYLNPAGKTTRAYFRTKAEAERKRGELIASTRTESRELILTNTQTLDAKRAIELLAQNGLTDTLVHAVEVALPTLLATGSKITISTLFADFLAIKQSEWRPLSTRNFKNCSKRFTKAFPSAVLTDINQKNLRMWLTTFTPSAASLIARTLSPAFSYAVRQGFISASPFALMEPIRMPQKKGIDIYTPEEASRLLQHAPADCIASFAILLFAGVRPTELTRLTWADIRDGFIHITPDNAKTAQVRNVEIEPTLAAWLNTTGTHAPEAPITPRNWRNKAQATRRAANLSGRPDTARHSYATYHLQKYRDKALLEANLGHSANSAMLMRHYRAASTPAEAEAYWSILPTAINQNDTLSANLLTN